MYESHYFLVSNSNTYYVKECGNQMTSKMVDWKIQTDLTHVKTIQYYAVGGILDFFLQKWGGLYFQFTIFEDFGLTF